MNARRHEFRLSLELRQVDDVVSCVFHSLMVHRTSPKIAYRPDSSSYTGSLGLTEVDCNFIDLTYIRLNSPELTARLEENVTAFRSDLDGANVVGSPRRTPVGSPVENAIHLMSASIGIEFYQRKNRSWPLSAENHAWEQWYLMLDIFKVTTQDELYRMRESVAEAVSDVVLSICSTVNRAPYVPKIPARTEISNVFDTGFSDCQPYLFNVNRQAQQALPTPVGSFSSMRRFLKDIAL